MSLNFFDLTIVGIYAVVLLAIAIAVSREPAGQVKDTEGYFLAGKSLPWWAIGASLIAANISAEQIIGQSGQGFVLGLAIAAYEWQAAIVLLITAKFFLPIFLERNIYTMPQFLETRFGGAVKSTMAFFWIALYTLVNLTSVLYGGGLALNAVTGVSLFLGMALIAAFATLYSLYGGLKAVALTDIIQVIVLIIGGVIITITVLGMVGQGAGPIAGLSTLFDEIPGHFKMILAPDHPSYADLPGIWTIIGGLWVLHFSYWGFNQYIIQRALGAATLAEAQKGLAFAAFLKLFLPLIIVLPGIAALYLAQNGTLDLTALEKTPDSTYGILITLVPYGLRGLVFAALLAAIVSSLASMMNSISTIFTIDVYRDLLRPNETEPHYVFVGRMAAFISIFVALNAALPFLGGDDSIFQTIQEYTGFIAPGVVGVFLLGFFWKRANTNGAFALLTSSVVLSLIASIYLSHVPFVIRIWIIFLLCMVVGVVVSLMTRKPSDERPVELSGLRFGTTMEFNIAATMVIGILFLAYALFW